MSAHAIGRKCPGPAAGGCPGMVAANCMKLCLCSRALPKAVEEDAELESAMGQLP
ncbi:uncharacterized protein J3R85_021050 [Psidium guajava]|nr:uncharacterized protein J3R85_021050 [Psidium guajava]